MVVRDHIHSFGNAAGDQAPDVWLLRVYLTKGLIAFAVLLSVRVDLSIECQLHLVFGRRNQCICNYRDCHLRETRVETNDR